MQTRKIAEFQDKNGDSPFCPRVMGELQDK